MPSMISCDVCGNVIADPSTSLCLQYYFVNDETFLSKCARTEFVCEACWAKITEVKREIREETSNNLAALESFMDVVETVNEVWG